MRPMRGVYMGIEWKPLTLESKNDDDEVIVNSNIQSLSVSPCLLYTSPSPRDQRRSPIPGSA